MGNKLNKKTKLILDIVSYVFVFLFFVAALTSCILKFSGVKFNVFGSRYDVVLTDSMSEKNEKYKEFLEGHDDQFNAFDVVKSEKIEKQSDIKLYDVVLYNDPNIGLNMHRIVNIVEDGKDIIKATDSSIKTIGDYSGISFDNFTSHFASELLSFDQVEMKVLSKTDGDGEIFDFNCSSVSLTAEIKKEAAGEYFIFTYNVKKDNSLPGYLYITYKHNHNFDNELILSLKVNSSNGEINATSADFSLVNDELVGEFNHSFRFETRGDKADTSDGMISFSKIEGKVVKRIPKLGYFLRFMESIWGVIMFILLGFIILGSAMLREHFDKKEVLATSGSSGGEEANDSTEKNESVKQSQAETIEQSKTVAQPKIEEPKQVEQPKVEETKLEPKVENTPKQTPQRVNGRFVSKNPTKPVSNSSRWTKENNPSINKKRAEGGDK